MKFVGVLGTSNARPADRYGKVGRRWHHRYNHAECSVGGLRGEALQRRVNEILPMEIASWPGLKLSNIATKLCYAGPYEGLTVARYLSTICSHADFSGMLAFIMLCNDNMLISQDTMAVDKVTEYFESMERIFGAVTGFSNVRHIVITTALYRQDDLLEGQEI